MGHDYVTKYVLLITREDGVEHEVSAWGTNGEAAIATLQTIIASTGGDTGRVRISVIDEDF